jgi:hypothetical protein
MKIMESKIVNRRALLSGAALLAGGVALAGCSAAQIASAEAQWATIVGQIQSAVAVGAQYIPTIESIVATAASLFGPGYAAIVQVGTAAFNQIVSTLTTIVTNLSPPAAARLRASLRGSAPSAPVTIGVTTGGVSVIGYRLG